MIRATATFLILATMAAPAFAQTGGGTAPRNSRAAAARQYDAEFDATDTNHDGVLSRTEMQARILKMQASGSRIDPVHARRLADLWFDSADTNKDGRVTRAEGQALLTRMMDAAEARRAAGGR